MDTFKAILSLFTTAERRQAFYLLLMVIVMAILDVLGVASILPFIAVLSNPEIVQSNIFLNRAFHMSGSIGIQNIDQFLLALGVGVFFFLIVSLAFKSVVIYHQTHFAMMREYSISKRLVEGYFRQPYSWFLDKNSSDLGKTVLSEVQKVVEYAIVPLMTLMAHGAASLALLLLLLVVDLGLALSVGFVLGCAYAGIYLVISAKLRRLGEQRLAANLQRYSVLNEGFAGIKEVIMGGLEMAYIRRFSKPSVDYAQSEASARVIARLPRYLLEALAFGGMLLMILYLMAKGGAFENALPIVALYAFAGYRLLPSLQLIYGALTHLRFVGPSLAEVSNDLLSLGTCSGYGDKIEALGLQDEIKLTDVTYYYPNAIKPALREINLSIPARSVVGIVGATGSGKTTIVDLILGLISPQNGDLRVDGNIIDEASARGWRRTIGYVPQQTYLVDDTLAANIALGVQSDLIDQTAVERAARIANLHDFITCELPNGYATKVGERGVRLSGGQRQRVGIARALYNNPQFLVLDESTSALDTVTENSVMRDIKNLRKDITIVLIAHRISTVRDCDLIYYLENGSVTAHGTYSNILNTSPGFAAMVDLVS